MYGSARCASALFHAILSVIIRMIFPPVARQRGIHRVFFGVVRRAMRVSPELLGDCSGGWPRSIGKARICVCVCVCVGGGGPI